MSKQSRPASRTKAHTKTPAGLWARYVARRNRLAGRDPRTPLGRAAVVKSVVE